MSSGPLELADTTPSEERRGKVICIGETGSEAECFSSTAKDQKEKGRGGEERRKEEEQEDND